MRDTLLTLALFSCCLLAVFCDFGCATLQPGADPLTVRVEQAETSATAAFDLILNVDDSNRTFWATNVPPFHAFAELLRSPTPVTGLGTNSLPKCLAVVWNVDQLKVSYKNGTASSNDVVTAFDVLTKLTTQATSWESVVTNTAAIH